MIMLSTGSILTQLDRNFYPPVYITQFDLFLNHLQFSTDIFSLKLVESFRKKHFKLEFVEIY